MVELPRVIVFQPVFSRGAAFDVRALGAQFWLADRITALGLEGASALARAPGLEPPELMATAAPDDDEIAAALTAGAARYGLVTTFAASHDQLQLAAARLLERQARAQTILRWHADEAEPLPAAMLRLLADVAARLDRALEPVSWTDVFDTDDVAVVGNYFTALGAVSVVEQGFAFDEEAAAASLAALLTGVRIGMRPAIDLLPSLVDALREHDRAPLELLRAAVETARSLVAVPPASWAEMLAAVGRGGSLVN